MRYDVVVVGGGIVGVSTAYFLAEKGVKRVLVLESNYIGGGSTFKCAGGIRASFTSRVHVILMKKSIELWGKLAALYGFPYRRSGYLWLIDNEEDYEKFREIQRFHHSLGLKTSFAAEDFVQEVAPALEASKLVAAYYDPLAGKASPFKSLQALFLASRDMGVEYRIGITANRLVSSDGKILGVETSKGILKADNVVLAAGTNTSSLLQGIGLSIPLEPLPRHAAITEEYGRAFDPLLVDVSTGAYSVQTSHGHVLMGVGVEERPGGPALERYDFLPKLLSVWTKWLPWLAEAHILRYWVGYYVMTPDHHPVVGPISRVEGVYVASGFSGHGFMMAPITGHEIAEWITSGKPSISETRELAPERFEMGKLIHEKAVIG